MFLGIDHIEIIVKDLNTHIKWYESLGYKLLRKSSHHGGSAELIIPGSERPIIELHQVKGEEVIGINHIAFQVEDAMIAVQELERLGIKIESGPNFFEPTGRILANFRDPDGWRIQIVSQISPSDSSAKKH
jgi:catechol 2,3-dioxygenase-like lactoylglutathione lyase family enzyme